MILKLSKTNEDICRDLGGLFERVGESLFLVGGAVRDAVLSREKQGDLDFTTSAPAERIGRITRPAATACYDKSRAKGYGTMGVRLKAGIEVEITPFRLCAGVDCADEGQAGVVSLAQDLQGRDFTINAVAMNAAPGSFGIIEDPWGGIADLRNRVLRTPIEPEKTFFDDPLRLVRAVRFAAAFCLRIDERTLETLMRMAAERPGPLDRVAVERVRDELLRMLELAAPSAALDLLRHTGLLAVALPEVQALAGLVPEEGAHHKDVFRHSLRAVDSIRKLPGGDDPILALAALMHDIGKPAARRLEDGKYSFPEHAKIGEKLAATACKRLRLSNEQAGRVCRLALLHHRLSEYAPEWGDAAVRRALNELGADFADFLALARADLTTSNPDRLRERQAALDDFLARVDAIHDAESVLNPRPPIDGNEIMQLLGLKSGGRDVGRVVDYLKEQIISGALDAADAEAAREMVLSGEWRR